MKICSRCKIEQALIEFNKEKQGKNGLRSDCRTCRKIYRDSRKEEIKKYHKEYHLRNKEKGATQMREWRRKNPEKAKEAAKRSTSTEKYREWLRDYRNKQYHERKKDPLFRLVTRVRNRTKNAIRARSFRKDFKYPDYIGCTREELRIYIESKFTDGMTWEKFMAGEIHIDHIIPIGKATSSEEVFRLSHYTNLQPLWAKDNLKKGAR